MTNTLELNGAAGSGCQTRLVRPLPAGSQIEYCDIRARILRDDGGSSVEVEIPGEGRMSWYWKFQGEECQIIQPNVPALAQSGGEETSTKEKTNE